MTAAPITPTSPKDLLVAHRAAKRTEATAKGAPTDRSQFPGLGQEPTGMVYATGSKLRYQPMKGKPEDLDADKLAALLVEPAACTVVPDAKTFGKLLGMADELPAKDDRALGRRLRIIRGLPVSVKLPVLTEALAYRYWLPDGLEENSFEDWAQAFGVKGATTNLTMRSLISLAAYGQRPSGLKYEQGVKGLEELERRIMDQAKWGGISNDCAVYSMLESISAKASGLRTLDPGLLDMHAIDGQVCKIVPMNSDSREFSASVSSPFKLKEGRKARLTDGKDVVEVDLRALRFGEGALHAVFSQPARGGSGPLMVSRAKALTAPLYALDGVFEAFGSGPKNRRWLSQTVVPLTGREVPLDVVLAGAPTE